MLALRGRPIRLGKDEHPARGGRTGPANGGFGAVGRRILTDLHDDRVAELRRERVGYFDQGGALIEGMSVLENVLLSAVPDRRVKQLRLRAESLRDELGVADRAGHKPDKLSGGERQRVALARALLLDPDIVMADEPTASLDRATADGVIPLLHALTERGIAVLAATHDQNLIDAAHSRTELA